MEKYESFKIINNFDIQQFNGLQNEVITHFHNPKGLTIPIHVSCFGITFPTPDYYIKRQFTRGFILEHVVAGRGYVVIDGKKNTVCKGDTYLVKPGESVEYYSDEKKPYEKLWVNFKGELPSKLVTMYKMHDTVYKNVDLVQEFDNLYALEKISTDVSEIHFEIAQIITQMILKLAKSVEGKKNISETAKTVLNDIHLSIEKPFNLNELCKKIFLSKSEIIRIFKNSYGITPYQYLLNLRINQAKAILENGNSSVQHISEILCFSSPYHFSQSFKKKVGLSPLQYRKKIQNG